ncbi:MULTISPECIES: hypothetical protein [Sinorhizobium]|uniref:hypothetical protein n=1 Tax=Sinorhizobium TaxID=28105 RepID=UPI0011ABE212|nr:MULTISPECIES: hypothetical protein [Sinorhizobium]MDW9439253.1 hypothetical protein [Sinorhizobium meliloti]MDW9484076.1 hypothetical protein [Sinorhizobium meliloti]MDX0523529.1 hypothetical protein [Sinorhizobium medicae]MDX0634252.1 hypothetical protein [Sinorhizobium medicae]MQV61392.1 hypothetical protein [Sinorhizobium meliloti]
MARDYKRDAIRLLFILNAGKAEMRIPMKSAIDSETKPATYSDFIPTTVPI